MAISASRNEANRIHISSEIEDLLLALALKLYFLELLLYQLDSFLDVLEARRQLVLHRLHFSELF